MGLIPRSKAHGIVQDAGSCEGDWVYAHLHRVEGDGGNALYWYSRCAKLFPEMSIEDEWQAIAVELLEGYLPPRGTKKHEEIGLKERVSAE